MPEGLKTLGQFKVESFLEDFVGALAAQFPGKIDFILLFGSAARGEFVIGKSDVDLVIQVKDDSALREVEEFAENVFWLLDEKYGLRLKEVCSTGIGSSAVEQAVKLVERQARLYKPFEVFGPNDIDWKKGRIKRLDLLPGAVFVASQLALFYKMKHEGRILFGRDVRREIKPDFSLWEKLKALWVPQSISFIAIFLSLILPKKAVSYSVKALFYEVESVNIFLKNRIPENREKLAEFADSTAFRNQLLDDLRFNIELRFGLLGRQKIGFVKKALEIKKTGFNKGRFSAIGFCSRAFWIIYSSNAAVILKSILGQKH